MIHQTAFSCCFVSPTVRFSSSCLPDPFPSRQGGAAVISAGWGTSPQVKHPNSLWEVKQAMGSLFPKKKMAILGQMEPLNGKKKKRKILQM